MTYIMCEHCKSLIPAEYWKVHPTQLKTITDEVFGVQTTMQIALVNCPMCSGENTLSESEWRNCKQVEPDDIRE